MVTGTVHWTAPIIVIVIITESYRNASTVSIQRICMSSLCLWNMYMVTLA